MAVGLPWASTAPAVHHRNGVGDRHHQLHVVFNQQDGEAGHAQADDVPGQIVRLAVVQPGRRFVQQKDAWPGDDGAGEFDALLHAVGQAACLSMRLIG